MTAYTDELQKVYELGLERGKLAGSNIPPGKGGSPGQPYQAPKDDPTNPWVPAPGKKKDSLAHGTHKAEDGWSQPPGTHPGEDHKLPGNSGEYYYNPMDGGDVEPWGPQHEMLIQNVAHNYRPGPTGGSLYNTLMIRANELMNAGEKDKALELLKISPSLYQLEKA